MEFPIVYKNQLIEKIRKIKKKNTPFCKKCYSFGHKTNSISCPLKKHIKVQLKRFILRNINEKFKDPKYNYNFTNIIKSIKDNKYSKNMCINELRSIKPEEKINIISQNDILCAEHIKRTCGCCNSEIYGIFNARHWKDEIVCVSCFNRTKQERNMLWQNVEQYLKRKNKFNYCNICNIPYNENDTFHLDHLNMFRKTDNICTMINSGENLDSILKEVDLCHWICLNCHGLITHFETIYGFTNHKKKINKMNNSNPIKVQQIEKYSKLYDTIMKNIYLKIPKIYNLNNSQA